MSHDQPGETRAIDYTTRHRCWEFIHRWGSEIGDTRTYRVSVAGRSVTVRDGRADMSLPEPVARSLALAILAACDAVIEP